jgi:hypothetical protein
MTQDPTHKTTLGMVDIDRVEMFSGCRMSDFASVCPIEIVASQLNPSLEAGIGENGAPYRPTVFRLRLVCPFGCRTF